MSLPPSMAWVPDFVTELNAFMDGRLYGWEVLEGADPLQRFLHLRARHPFLPFEPKFMRNSLKLWAEANGCVYRRSTWKGQDFKAEVLLKALRPESRVNPYLETDDEAVHRNRRSRLGLPGRSDLRRGSNNPSRVPPGVAASGRDGFEEDHCEAEVSDDSFPDSVD